MSTVKIDTSLPSTLSKHGNRPSRGPAGTQAAATVVDGTSGGVEGVIEGSASEAVEGSTVVPDAIRRRPFIERIERFISRLSTRNAFWHKVCSLIWLPYAFRSGITMKRIDSKTFAAVLPFRRFNRNWYNAMAGAALLGNSEVAAGMYLFSRCGSDYVVVCRNMNYRFLRPCHGPAVYHVVRSDDLDAKLTAGGEFNIDLEMEIRQQVKRNGRELRVGRCHITFHCTPKSHVRQRGTKPRRRGARRGRARSSGSEA